MEIKHHKPGLLAFDQQGVSLMTVPAFTNDGQIPLTAQTKSERIAREKEIEDFQKNFTYTLDEDGIPRFINTVFAAY